MFKSKLIRTFLAGFAACVTAGCSGAPAQVKSDEWSEHASDTIDSVRASIDAISGNYPTPLKLEQAMAMMRPLTAHPESMRLQVRQDFSFDATPPVQATLGPTPIVSTLEEIAYDYELLGDWQKAGNTVALAIDFADRFNKAHPEDDKSKRFDFQVGPVEYVSLDREYARCLERTGDSRKSRDYSTSALAKLATIDCQPTGKLTGWAASVADSTRRSCATEYDDLGIVALERGDPANEIEPLFKKAIDLSSAGDKPANVPTAPMQHLALLLMKEKRYPDAQKFAQKAYDAEHAPSKFKGAASDTDAAVLLSQSLWLQGKNKEAISILQAAVEPERDSQSAIESFARGWTQLAYYYKLSGNRRMYEDALRVANAKANRLAEYAAGLRQSCHIPYLADSVAAQTGRINSDLKAISAKQPLALSGLQTVKPEFDPFRPPIVISVSRR
jgi:tetratricopeptide (TPR) repeat protein